MGMSVSLFDGPVPAVGERRPPELRSRGLERAFLENPTEWLQMLFGGGTSGAGVTVTPAIAMESTAFGPGVRVIAEDLGSLPCFIYRRLADGGREPDPDHHLYPILHDVANDETDAGALIETVTAWSAGRGRGYAEIVHNGAGKVTALWQVPPERVTPMRVQEGDAPAELVFHVKLPAGQRTADGRDFYFLTRERIFRLNGISLDGVSGLNPAEQYREAIGLTIALERHGAKFFGNGAAPGGVIEHPDKLGDVAYARLKAAWEARHKGIENAHRVAILEEGMTWKATTLQNDHAQFLESRKFQLREGARIHRVKPHKVGDLEDATFSNIEHESIDHVVSTIRPWAVRWERAIRHQLLTPEERRTHYAEFKLEALLRGDTKTQFEAFAIGRQWGWLSTDDVREKLNMNPLPDGQGKVYLIPQNMWPADKLDVLVKKAAAEKPAASGESKPAAAPDAGAPPAAAQDAEVLPELVLNGAQVVAATAIVKSVAVGELPRDAGIGQLMVLFNLSKDQAEQIMGSVGNGFQPTAPAKPGAAGGAPAPDDEDEADEEDEDPPARADRHLVAAAMRPVFEAAFRSVVNREATALGKAAKKGEGLAALDAAAATFYEGHAAAVREALRPAARALAGLLGVGAAAADTYVDTAAARYTRRSLQELSAAVRAEPTSPVEAVERLTRLWMEKRAHDLGEREVAHAIETLAPSRA